MSTWSRLATVALGICLCLLVGLRPAAADADKDKENSNDHKNQKNVATLEQRHNARTNDAGKAVEEIDLAHRLARYGRDHDNADALIVAAEILANVPPARPLTEKPRQVPNKNENETPASKNQNEGSKNENAGNKNDNASEKSENAGNKNDNANTVRHWLNAAIKLSNNDPAVLARANKVQQNLEEKHRGDVRGPQEGSQSLPPGYHDDWDLKLRAGEVTNISVNSASPLAVDLYDENKNWCTGGYGTAVSLQWQPYWTGAFTLRISNSSNNSAVPYHFYTN